MKGIEVHVPEQAPEVRKPLRLKPAGWLALGVIIALVLSALGVAGQELYRATRTVEDLPTVPAPPTYTPTPTRTPTPAPTATPRDWSAVQDPLTRQEFLSPPPDADAAIRQAFNVVMAACIAVEDAPDDVLRAHDAPALKQNLDRYAAPAAVSYCMQRDNVTIRTLAPEGQVQCTDHENCKIARAALGFQGMILYNAESCGAVGLEAPCVIRVGKHNITSDSPYGIAVIATAKLEDGKWLITDWLVERLPPPPSSPSSP